MYDFDDRSGSLFLAVVIGVPACLLLWAVLVGAIAYCWPF
jgi:hypothetical protein